MYNAIHVLNALQPTATGSSDRTPLAALASYTHLSLFIPEEASALQPSSLHSMFMINMHLHIFKRFQTHSVRYSHYHSHYPAHRFMLPNGFTSIVSFSSLYRSTRLNLNRCCHHHHPPHHRLRFLCAPLSLFTPFTPLNISNILTPYGFVVVCCTYCHHRHHHRRFSCCLRMHVLMYCNCTCS